MNRLRAPPSGGGFWYTEMVMVKLHRQFIDLATLLTNRGRVVDTWLPNLDSKFDQWLPQTTVYEHGQPATAVDNVLAALPTEEGESRSVVATQPFDRIHLASWNIWHHGETFQLAVKGAPETTIGASRLTESEAEAALLAFQRLSKHGWQVLAIAHGEFAARPGSTAIFSPQTLHFDGLVALEYDPQPHARKLLMNIRQANRTPILLAAESPEMTTRLAHEFAIASSPAEVFDTTLLDELPSRNFSPELLTARAFARLTPNRLERVVTTLTHDGKLAMANDVRQRIEHLATYRR